MTDSSIGQVLRDKYIILKYINEGTFSHIFLVYDAVNNIFFAAKRYERENYYIAKSEIDFLKTMDSNQHIIKLYDSFIDRNHVYLILELLGDSLYDTLCKNNISSIETIRHIMKCILSGVGELHANGIIHCDLKTDNILSNVVNPKINALINYLTALNLVGIKDEFYTHISKNIEHSEANRLTIYALRDYIMARDISAKYSELVDDSENTYRIIDMGSAEYQNNIENNLIYHSYYRPPEVLYHKNYSCKSDIWVIGCIFYELLTNEILIDESTIYTEIKQNRHFFRESLDLFNVDESVIELLDNMICYDECDRKTCEELLDFAFFQVK
jgi:serine/threonine protein kinase